MKKLNNTDLDIYLFIKDYIKENGIAPSHREIIKNTNIKSTASVKYSIEKLEELRFLKLKRNENNILKSRGIKLIDNEHTKELINNLRDEFREKENDYEK